MRSYRDDAARRTEAAKAEAARKAAEDKAKADMIATLTAGMSAEDKASFLKDFEANLAAKGPKIPKV